MIDSYTRALERRVRLLLREQERLDREVRELREEKRDLAERLRRHAPKERQDGHQHAANILESVAAELDPHPTSASADHPKGA